MLIEKREKKIYASHTQFYIDDVDQPGDTSSPEFWTDQAFKDQLAVVPGTIGIGTGTYGSVLVVMEAHDCTPEFDCSQWDHVTEASLDVTQGRLQIVGCLDDGNEELFEVQARSYRVRCCHANLEGADEFGDGKDWYLVQFWPANPQSSKVLKYWKRKSNL